MSILKNSSVHLETKSRPTIAENPTPFDFDRYIPWVMLGDDNVQLIAVRRLYKAEDPTNTYKKQPNPKHALNKISSLNNMQVASTEVLTKKGSNTIRTHNTGSSYPCSSTSLDKDIATVSAFYSSSGYLVEVGFINCPVPVPRQVFDAISICLPFHPQLTRITWNGRHLTGVMLYEISKLLQGSHLTDVILDNSYTPHRNYYILLDHATSLKFLSLSCCRMDDEIVEKIAERIQRKKPAADSLIVLNLSRNYITDVGAQALGHSLRTNRRLCFLNLCSNSITSVGAAYILLPLTKFKLDDDEKREMQLIKWELAKQVCILDNENKLLNDVTNVKMNDESSKRARVNKELKATNKELMANKGIKADDIFWSNAIEISGAWYSLGNLTLCSLNLAYNKLDSDAVSRIAEVVSYQYGNDMGPKTGLLRVVIEGNLLPIICPEYDLIKKFINLALNTATTTRKQTKSGKSLVKIK